jgi:hypothetical protein
MKKFKINETDCDVIMERQNHMKSFKILNTDDNRMVIEWCKTTFSPNINKRWEFSLRGLNYDDSIKSYNNWMVFTFSLEDDAASFVLTWNDKIVKDN